MANIMTTIELADRISSPIMNISNALNMTVTAFRDIDTASSDAFESVKLDGIQNALNTANAELIQFAESTEAAKRHLESNPITVPVVWDTSKNVEVFTNTGVERFKKEVESANYMLQKLGETQRVIAARAGNAILFPKNMATDINNIGIRMDAIRSKIQAIENNPINLGSDIANRELESLRSQLNLMIGQQEELNRAVDKMDMSAANASYNQLNSTISDTERYIRDNVDEQGNFTNAVKNSVNSVQTLNSTFSNLMQGLGIMTLISKAVNMITSSFDSAISRYDTLNNFPKLMEMMGYSADEAAAATQRLSEGLNGLPTALNEMTGYVTQFEVITKDLNYATESALALNNATLASGKSADVASRATDNYLTMLGKGSIDAMHWKSLTSDMTYALQEVAESFGYASIAVEGDFYTALQNGDVTMAELNNRFIELSNTTGGFAEVALTATGGIGTAFKNMGNAVNRGLEAVITAFDTVLANTQFESLQGLIVSLGNAFETALNKIAGVINVVGYLIEQFPILGVILKGLAMTVGVLAGILALYAVKLAVVKVATLLVTAAQWLWNAALSASPVVWIVALIALLVVAVYKWAKSMAETSEVANSAFGVITGGIFVVGAFFKNLGQSAANIFFGIAEAANALGENIQTAFGNAIKNVQAWFYNLLSTALTTISRIASALNELPFIEFDYSGVTNAASEYAQKAADLLESKGEYRDIGAAFKEGMSTYDTWQDGWKEEAFAAGAAWGDGISDKISGLFNPAPDDSEPVYQEPDFNLEFGNSGSNLGNTEEDYLDSIDTNTANIANAVSDSSDAEIKYLKEIAEKLSLDKPSTVEVKVDVTNNNTVSSDSDIDGIINKVTEQLGDAILSEVEGAYAY